MLHHRWRSATSCASTCGGRQSGRAHLQARGERVAPIYYSVVSLLACQLPVRCPITTSSTLGLGAGQQMQHNGSRQGEVIGKQRLAPLHGSRALVAHQAQMQLVDDTSFC
jgi:hypothetical protein